MLNNTAKLARFRQQMCQILGQRANSKMEVNAQIYAPAVAARLFASSVLESLPIPSMA